MSEQTKADPSPPNLSSPEGEGLTDRANFQPTDGGVFVIPEGRGIDDLLAHIEKSIVWNVALDEGQRQMVLLGLKTLRQERPDWDFAPSDVEAKLGGQVRWPTSDLPLCLRCMEGKPGAHRVTLATGAQYCLQCLPSVKCAGGAAARMNAPVLLAAPGLPKGCAAPAKGWLKMSLNPVHGGTHFMRKEVIKQWYALSFR